MNVVNIIIFVITLEATPTVFTQTLNIESQEYFTSLGYEGLKPEFKKRIYKASIDNEAVIQIDEKNIILENCHTATASFQLIFDGSKYLPILPPPPAYPSIGNCSVLMSPIILKRKFATTNFMDLIKLRAVHKNYVLSETSIVILEQPPYLNYDESKYIVLNYFNFKIFLTLILLTGVGILLIELREIYLKCKDRTYRELHNTINYI